MGWRNTLQDFFFYKAVQIDDALFSDNWDSANWSGSNFDSLSREGYEHNATVYRCVNLVSKTAAGVILGVFDEEDDGEELVKNHPFTELIKRPNPLMGRAAFQKYWAMCLLLGGRSFIWANRLQNGRVHEMWVIPPNDVEVKFGSTFGTINSFIWSYQGNQITLPVEDVMYTWFPHPRDPMLHMAPLKAGAQEVDLENESLRWNLSLMTKGAKPSAYVSIDKMSDQMLNPEQIDRIKRMLKDDYSGARNAGKIPIFPFPGMQLTNYGWTPQDMDWLSGMDKSDVRIANIFDVPPELVGANKTYENFAVAQRVLYENAVLPLLDLFADELTNWGVFRLDANQRIAPQRERIKALQEDQKEVSTRVINEVKEGIRTRNEARMAVQLEASVDPMADVLTVSANTQTLAEAQFDSNGENESIRADEDAT